MTQMDKKHLTWICSVLFMDIVGYPKFDVEEQMAVRRHYFDLVDGILHTYCPDDYITLDAGDGMAVCYTGDPEDVHQDRTPCSIRPSSSRTSSTPNRDRSSASGSRFPSAVLGCDSQARNRSGRPNTSVPRTATSAICRTCSDTAALNRGPPE